MFLTNIQNDFPVLSRKVNGHRIVYLDSAASSLKPRQVIDEIHDFYLNHYSNVYRAVHTLSSESTERVEKARNIIASFLNVNPEEIIFTSGTTMSLNTIVESMLRCGYLRKDDTVLVTAVEHHANFVPWVRLSKLHGFKVEFIMPSGRFGTLEEKDFLKYKNSSPKIVSVTGHSNVTGQVVNLKMVRNLFPKSIFIVDGAQLIPHDKIDVKDLDIDFLAFSAHKMLGPSGVGVLFGKRKFLEEMEPFMYGGEMIDKVGFEDVSFNELPYKFEAGTPNIAGIVGFGEAIKYLENLDFGKIKKHIYDLTNYALERLKQLNGIEIYGPTDQRHLGIISFNLEGIHPHDVAHLLDEHFGVAVRSGHHCAQPLMTVLKNESKLSLFPNGTCRASFYIYNTKEDIEIFVEGLKKIKEWFDVQ
ncbi:SufS family cysteine desulfurase [Thermosipho atlanticus]|uniref:Cysteine desulfurase n=1 Tax=Thermosipho atlanticus DSM 15807 TaxID=1123380 RepID=A0A1M5SE99_9BACT|nr:SufS family cysteine desulfurase [Thermosipho atlanticus]SHH36932.1 cysteine desulfurase [Thermosipho atlanticus DSM 15807]